MTTDPKTSLYVAGLMFNARHTHVALIRKTKPAWQKDKLNGIGGKVEPGESPIEAMVREFHEEAGVVTDVATWAHFLSIRSGEDVRVDFFAATGDLGLLRSMEAEHLEMVALTEIPPTRPDVVDGVPWIVPLGLHFLRSAAPFFVVSTTAEFQNEPSSDSAPLKRGDIKKYREKLNRDSAGQPLWKHNGSRGQRVRPYGDYLYAQDREKFMVEVADWVEAGRPA